MSALEDIHRIKGELIGMAFGILILAVEFKYSLDHTKAARRIHNQFQELSNNLLLLVNHIG